MDSKVASRLSFIAWTASAPIAASTHPSTTLAVRSAKAEKVERSSTSTNCVPIDDAE